MHEGDAPEYFTLLLTATLGMCLMSSTANLLMLVIVVETASLPSYVLAGFRKTHRLGAEASLKYVLFGAASSALMIYGLSLLYGMFGTLQIDGTFGIAAQIATTTQPLPLLIFAAASVIVGLGFKISVVPLHFWCPDVFEGAGIDIAAFLSVASKGAAILLLTRVCMLGAEALGFADGRVSLISLAFVLGLIGAVTATVGNTAAFNQTNIKRLLAWSSIAHAGYIMCGISLLVSNNLQIVHDGVNQPMQAILVYLSVYLFMNLGAFTVAALVFRATGSETLPAYQGLGRRAPLLALLMTVFMFSLVGLPPFAGFVAKLNLMWRLGANGGWWWALVAVIGVNTVFSLYYYARVVKAMYLEQGEDERPLRPQLGGVAVAFACALMLVVMFLGFSPFTRIAENGSRMAGVDAPVKVTQR
jgi:NADH-quinone oxidoreductase subunit N